MPEEPAFDPSFGELRLRQMLYAHIPAIASPAATDFDRVGEGGEIRRPTAASSGGAVGSASPTQAGDRLRAVSPTMPSG